MENDKKNYKKRPRKNYEISKNMTAVIGDIQYLHILKMKHTIIENICW